MSTYQNEIKAIAIANNDYVHVAWNFGAQPIAGCGGFAVYRIEKGGDPNGQALPAFDRDSSGKRLKVTCEDQPIRKYNWRDVYAKRGGTYKYKVIPMRAPRQPLTSLAVAETDWVVVSGKYDKVQVYFNRGILGTQHTADDLWNPAKKKPDFAKIEQKINDPKDDLRKSLCGQLYEALTQLLDRAKRDGGSCWASLYEMTDPQLIDRLTECKDLHLILSNDNDEKQQNKKKVVIYDGKNQPGVKKLKNAKEIIRRYMPSGHIGHNKFFVYCDKVGNAKAVLTGSTNWTASGLCTQSNNAILIEDDRLASDYLQYWKDLKTDALAAGVPKQPAPMKGIQGQVLRTACATPRDPLPQENKSTVTVWYSPNTHGAMKSGAKTAPPTPVDMQRVYDLIHKAQQSVLFLAFMPGKAGSEGSFHFLKELAKAAAAKPELFVRGAVSDPDLTKEFDLSILTSGVSEDAMISSPQGIFKNFEAWREEIYKYGHAIIHDKTIVIDPFGSKCAVITGSHNLGFRASSNNDENMLIIEGDPEVAKAYAAHVMDIFEHYRSRWINAGHKTDDYDPRQDPNWQQRYFEDFRPAYAERLFWIASGGALPLLKPNPHTKGVGKHLEQAAEAKKEAAAKRKAMKKAAGSGSGD